MSRKPGAAARPLVTRYYAAAARRGQSAGSWQRQSAERTVGAQTRRGRCLGKWAKGLAQARYVGASGRRGNTPPYRVLDGAPGVEEEEVTAVTKPPWPATPRGSQQALTSFGPSPHLPHDRVYR